MKKILILLNAFLFVWLAGCGSSAAPDKEISDISVSQDTESAGVAEQSATSDQLEVIYLKKLNDSSIMAACNTDEGIAALGEDYFVVHVGDAEIYNAQGEKVTLDQLVRGCELQIEWPGMVMESYPAQISASVVRAIQDEPLDGVPAENEIPNLFGGPTWWEDDPILENSALEGLVPEIPALELDYKTEDFAVHAIINHHTGSWSYGKENDDGTFSGSMQNALLDGARPTDWLFDDNNTIKRNGVDRIRLSTSPAASEMTVQAYSADHPEEPAKDLALDDDGYLYLMDGNYIYVVKAGWEQGNAVYGFLVTEE